jgi:hypothetical protein
MFAKLQPSDFTTSAGRWPLRSNLACLENIFTSCFLQILVCALKEGPVVLG